jgi:hypothetical protein
MNSLHVPADSLKATLHFPNRNGDCFYCNEVITFIAGLNRYVGNDGIHCRETLYCNICEMNYTIEADGYPDCFCN